MKYDIAIVGGGHAGAEAAWISSSFGLDICLITHKNVPICRMPCNPSIGGVGKGQVVRELDALGGLMGKVADRSSIQYRILNEGKGYAVQSTRAQVDKNRYSTVARKFLEEREGITIIEASVDLIERIEDSYRISGSDLQVLAQSVVVTGGTFFSGVMHVGAERSEGGSIGACKSGALASVIPDAPTLRTKFKTGTPARLDISSINFCSMVEQESDPRAINFSITSERTERFLPQISCFLTETNARTLKIIRDAKESSPLFNGQISGVGPRYCPSIEDKAFRYPEKDCHHVFVEPEGEHEGTVYPNGLSTSLPGNIQLSFLRTIKGFEKCTVKHFGYAVEYDVIDAQQLDRTLQVRTAPGLYFAGQINGTSGYEEAAAQGFIAGVNAALRIKGSAPFVLEREDSYIGVLIEDLVTSERDEPYRLFTARSENRLHIREDNTVERMCPYRTTFGLDEELDQIQDSFMSQLFLLNELVNEYSYHPCHKTQNRFSTNNYGAIGQPLTLKELICRANLDPVTTLQAELSVHGVEFDYGVIRSVAISAKYSGYIERSAGSSKRLSRLNRKRVNWHELTENPNISIECRQRIERVRPETFSELRNINGIRPATLAYVASTLL